MPKKDYNRWKIALAVLIVMVSIPLSAVVYIDFIYLYSYPLILVVLAYMLLKRYVLWFGLFAGFLAEYGFIQCYHAIFQQHSWYFLVYLAIGSIGLAVFTTNLFQLLFHKDQIAPAPDLLKIIGALISVAYFVY